jgi:DNA primase
MIARQSVEQVIDAAPIEEVVGQYLTLKKRGSNYIGLCPFHDEKTPSFNVNPARGIYKCFGCGKGGNSVQFVMELDQVSFVEAVRKLAHRYGIDLIETGQPELEELQEEQKQRESLYAVLDFAAGWFERQLHETEDGRNIGLSYFRERGLEMNTIRHWKLGFAPDQWNAFLQAAEQGSYNKEFLEAASLVKKSESGRWFDMFRNRVIFPVFSVSGRVIAFGGRVMGKAEGQPKYINSAESPVYHKSDHLFGLFQAKASVKKKDKVFLTEGYTDVITLYQAGIDNVVASSGTALTENQIRLIRRFTPNVTVLYDGDAAGIKASLRGIDLMLREDLNVRVVRFPDGEDPDSLCRKLGPVGFAAYLDANEENFILFKARLLFDGAGSDPILRADAIRDILQSLSLIRDSIKRTELVRQLSEVSGQAADQLLYELNRLVRNVHKEDQKQANQNLELMAVQTATNLKAITFDDLHQEQGLLRLVIKHGQLQQTDDLKLWQMVAQELLQGGPHEFTDPLCARAFAHINRIFADGEELDAHHFIGTADQELAAFAADALSREYTLSDHWAKHEIAVMSEEANVHQEFLGIFTHLRRKKLDLILRDILQKFHDLTSEGSEEEALLMDYYTYTQAMRNELVKQSGTVVTSYPDSASVHKRM